MIKLTDEISSILIDENSIIAIVPTSNHFGSRKTCVHLSGGSKLIVNETPEEILAMPDIEEDSKAIDWGQRRYEIAKEMLPIVYYEEKPREVAVNEAVRYADALIKELKEGGEKCIQ